ncbi:MAG: BON domain-containing protein [Gammaproteobacteria bacterium]|nr:BON domain-containing protein [Gammaproteobacteria bacterium]
MKLINKLLFPVIIVSASLLVGCANTAAHESTGQFFDSSLMTTKIKTKLADNFGAKTISNVSVSTYKSDVTLRGTMKNQAQIAKAAAIAQNTAGVKSVNNLLSVKK